MSNQASFIATDLIISFQIWVGADEIRPFTYLLAYSGGLRQPLQERIEPEDLHYCKKTVTIGTKTLYTKFMRRLLYILLALQIIIWFAFGAIILIAGNPPLIPDPFFQKLLGVSSLAVSILLTILTVNLRKQNPWILYGLLCLLTAILIATFLDDLGPVDFTFAGLTLITAALLFNQRHNL